jgi:hypothetical protein
MSDTRITIEGYDAVLRGLLILPERVLESVRDALAPVLRDLQGRLATYPPERPAQRYQRTGDLGRGWTGAQPQYIFLGTGLEARIINPTDYASFVQGDDQAWMHAGRWQTAERVLLDYEDELTAAVERGSTEGARKAGLL